MTRLSLLLLGTAALALGVPTRPALAQNTLFISGNVMTQHFWQPATQRGDGTPGSCGVDAESVNYFSAPFSTDQTADTYSLHLYYESFQSSFVYLYRDAFDPQNPCVGIVAFGYGPLANLYDLHLDAGRTYVFVTSEAELYGGGGSFQVTINGPEGSHLRAGTAGSTTATGPEAGAAFALSAPAPSPAYGATTLTLTLGRAGTAAVQLYDATGRRVAVLHDGALAAGTHTLTLDAATLPAGAYVVRAVVDGAAHTRRLIVR